MYQGASKKIDLKVQDDGRGASPSIVCATEYKFVDLF
jgi:hypothetical protein